MGAPYAPIQPSSAENGGVAFLQHDVDVIYAYRAPSPPPNKDIHTHASKNCTPITQ
jgi:hypothetical protein